MDSGYVLPIVLLLLWLLYEHYVRTYKYPGFHPPIRAQDVPCSVLPTWVPEGLGMRPEARVPRRSSHGAAQTSLGLMLYQVGVSIGREGFP
jgi:hypothetical protein